MKFKRRIKNPLSEWKSDIWIMIQSSFTHDDCNINSILAWFDWISASIDSNAHPTEQAFYDRFITIKNILRYKSSYDLFSSQFHISYGNSRGKGWSIVGCCLPGYRTFMTWEKQDSILIICFLIALWSHESFRGFSIKNLYILKTKKSHKNKLWLYIFSINFSEFLARWKNKLNKNIKLHQTSADKTNNRKSKFVTFSFSFREILLWILFVDVIWCK